MIQNLETTLKSGGVPQVPQFRPSTVSPASNFASVTTTQKNSNAPNSSTEKKAIPNNEVAKGKEEDKKTENAVSASEKPAQSNGVVKDPLGDARNKVQDEIIKEFAAIMATGTMRASEAAALATRRVMERHGQMSVSQS
jgi:desumoylating isopeptidase 1